MMNKATLTTTTEKPGARPAAAPTTSLTSQPPHALLALQNRAGNRAVSQLVHNPPLTLQTQLKINALGDSYEQEAHQVAHQVLSTPVQTAGRRAPMSIQGMTRSAGRSADPVPTSVNRVLAGAGHPLDATLQQDMEQRFGYDFSQVRVHTDAQAAESANGVNALAYTVGQDVVFGAGQYAPQTRAGQSLLAHELTHVLQNAVQRHPARIQRYESPEHQDLGDSAFLDLDEFLKQPAGAAWIKQYKLNAKALAARAADPMLLGRKFKVGKNRTVPVTAGDVIALMGDFYRTPEALMAAPDQEINELLATISRERKGELSGGRANAAYQAITNKYRPASDTFLELAKVNAPHFTPTNRDAWKKLHLTALKKAVESRKAGQASKAMLEEALIYDAAGGHFLTDAFASGHLFNKKKLEDAIILYLRQNPPHPSNPEVQTYFAIAESQGVTHQLVLKNIHDRLNVEGVKVTNKQGMTWRTYGDDHLKKSPDTSKIAALAVYLSRQQIMQASIASTTPDPADLERNADEVLNLLPDDQSVEQVTKQAIDYIPQAVLDLTALFYRQRLAAGEGLKAAMMGNSKSAVKGFFAGVATGIITSNLKTVTDPGRPKQLLEQQERARQTGTSQVAPQFTIFDW